jgi:hypothetical protein
LGLRRFALLNCGEHALPQILRIRFHTSSIAYFTI